MNVVNSVGIRRVLYVVLRDCLLFVLVCVFCLICLLLSIRLGVLVDCLLSGLVVFLDIVGFLVVVCRFGCWICVLWVWCLVGGFWGFTIV